MKVLTVSFSPRRMGACAAALKYAGEELFRLEAIPKALYVTSASGVCLGCYRCKSGEGCISDAVNMLSEEIAKADAAIFATPTHFGLASATAYAMLSRVIMSRAGVLMNKPVFSLATARRGGGMGAISDLDRLIAFSGAPLAGGCYPTLLYGSSEAEILKDEEGLFNLRERIRRLVWLARCIKAGELAGIEPPSAEVRPKTDIHSVMGRG